MSITAPIAAHAQTTPDRAAIVFDDDVIHWRELGDLIDRLGAFLAERTPIHSSIALHLPNCPALAALFLAAARTGGEAQILDPAWPAETTQAILRELKPALVVTTDHTIDVPNTICLANAFLPFNEIAALFPATNPSLDVPEPEEHLPFYVGFTSGSTGVSKGYRRNHRSWTESFRADAKEFGIKADDVVLAPGSLTHSLFLYALAHGLHTGATVVLCARFRPTSIPALMRKHDVSILYAVPTQLQLILDSPSAGPEHNRLRWVLSSGAKWPSREMSRFREQFPTTRFAEFYGASELSFVTVAKDDEPVPENSVGRAFAGVTVTIRDFEGRQLKTGETGLVFVESPFVFCGYATGSEADLYRAGSAVSVGDFGILDQDGFLFLVGRAKRMIVSSGKNIFPEEIERVLERHPAIAHAAVFGLSDDKRGERLIALISPRTAPLPTMTELTAALRTSLPLHKIPRRFGIVLTWPTTRSDKTDFEALHELLERSAFQDLA